MRIPTTDEIIRKLDETYKQKAHEKTAAQGIQCYLAMYYANAEHGVTHFMANDIADYLKANCNEYGQNNKKLANTVSNRVMWLADKTHSISIAPLDETSEREFMIEGPYPCAMIFINKKAEETTSAKANETESLESILELRRNREVSSKEVTDNNYGGFKTEVRDLLSRSLVQDKMSLDVTMMKILAVYAKYTSIDAYRLGRESVKEEMRKALNNN